MGRRRAACCLSSGDVPQIFSVGVPGMLGELGTDGAVGVTGISIWNKKGHRLTGWPVAPTLHASVPGPPIDPRCCSCSPASSFLCTHHHSPWASSHRCHLAALPRAAACGICSQPAGGSPPSLTLGAVGSHSAPKGPTGEGRPAELQPGPVTSKS